MIVYAFMIIISTFFASLVVEQKSNEVGIKFFKYYSNGKVTFNINNIIFFILALIVPIVVEMIRYEVGTDQIVYATIRVPKISEGLYSNVDIDIPMGYRILVKILSYLASNGYVIYGLTTAIEIILFYLCFIQNSKIFWLSVLLFFLLSIFNTSLNNARQMLAVGIFFYSIRYIRKKRFIPYCICVLLATSIHTVSIIYLLVYFFYKINLRKRFKAIIFLVMLYIFNKPFVNLLEIISRNNALLGKYYLYFRGIYFADSFSWTLAFVTVVPVVLYMFFDRLDIEHQDQEIKNVYFNIACTSCIPALLNLWIPNADRFVFMFLPVHALYVPDMARRLTGKQRKFFIVTMILLFLVFYIYYIGILNCGQTLPYKTFWS